MPSNIQKTVSALETEITLHFTDTAGKKYEATVIRDQANLANPDIKVKNITDNVDVKHEQIAGSFLFCEEDATGTIEHGGKKYSPHVLREASEGAFLLTNPSCPLFLNPPGIWINL